MAKWQKLSSKIVHYNPYFKIFKDQIKTSAGHLADYYFLDRNNFAVAIPILDDQFVMVSQYRYPIKQQSLEFPMGGSNKGEDLKACARREMVEESAYDSEKFTFLGEVAPTPGHSSQRFQVFLAENLHHVGQHNRDQLEEGMEIEKVKISDFPKLVKDGTIVDGPTLAAYALYIMCKGKTFKL